MNFSRTFDETAHLNMALDVEGFGALASFLLLAFNF
jgi:hypothetical protein